MTTYEGLIQSNIILSLKGFYLSTRIILGPIFLKFTENRDQLLDDSTSEELEWLSKKMLRIFDDVP